MEELVECLVFKTSSLSVGEVEYAEGTVTIDSRTIKYASEGGRLVEIDLDKVGLVAINEEQKSVYCQADESGVVGVEGMRHMIEEDENQEEEEEEECTQHTIEAIIKPVDSEIASKIFSKLSAAVKVLDAAKEYNDSSESEEDSSADISEADLEN